MFHPDCLICFPPNTPPKHGHAGVREVFADFIPLRPHLKSTITGLQINGDIALLQADWVFTDADGNMIAEGQSTEVARRLENGGWGYFIDCPEGPPTPIASA